MAKILTSIPNKKSNTNTPFLGVHEFEYVAGRVQDVFYSEKTGKYIIKLAIDFIKPTYTPNPLSINQTVRDQAFYEDLTEALISPSSKYIQETLRNEGKNLINQYIELRNAGLIKDKNKRYWKITLHQIDQVSED
jgi:hypothetical protein